MSANANDKQVGGTHYKVAIEHWDVVILLGWDYLVGTATKHLWRLGKKHPSIAGQIEDVSKAIHYLEKKLETLKAQQQRELKNIGHKVDELNGVEGEANSAYVNQDR